MPSYLARLKSAAERVPADVVDFRLARRRGRAPTQAFSEFLINREQGDWAERLVMDSINASDLPVVAVKYGRSEDRVAGEEGFTEFYNAYQDELDTIGKRPDLLLVRRGTPGVKPGDDVSLWDRERLDPLVRSAVLGLEVRSSAFLEAEFLAFRRLRAQELAAELNKALEALRTLKGVAPAWREWASSNGGQPVDGPPRASGKVGREEMQVVRSVRADSEERDYLSFTLKAEDFLVVRRWIETFGVPHAYAQVFFDKAYLIGFCEVLELLGSSPPGRRWQREENPKNQFKSTVHVNTDNGALLIPKIAIPGHRSDLKRLGRGRILPFIRFEAVPWPIDGKVLEPYWRA